MLEFWCIYHSCHNLCAHVKRCSYNAKHNSKTIDLGTLVMCPGGSFADLNGFLELSWWSLAAGVQAIYFGTKDGSQVGPPPDNQFLDAFHVVERILYEVTRAQLEGPITPLFYDVFHVFIQFLLVHVLDTQNTINSVGQRGWHIMCPTSIGPPRRPSCWSTWGGVRMGRGQPTFSNID
jgi:hypothetical protein